MTHSELTESLQRAACQNASKRSESPSGHSTASSSSSSDGFSADGQSSQSSAPSSAKSASLSLDGDATCADSSCPTITRAAICKPSATGLDTSLDFTSNAPTALPAELRVHPRRTQPAGRADGKGAADTRLPPSLVKQSDRKDNFVESLVDTTSQMIEVIWPLSMVPCGRDSFGGKNLIGLRLFIQEVLRRSKTSYSTLQVALYYLILIKPCIPRVDFTKEQLEDSHTARAMQCGRRMFLAALILASKYLQDRTYSARAWSKISGLSTAEINSNEIAFVTAVNWKLHIPEPLFQRWTDIVLKYSSPSVATQTQRPGEKASWRTIVAQLTPALDNVDVGDVRAQCARRAPPAMSMSPPPISRPSSSASSATPRATLPVAAPKPEPLEPNLSAAKENYKFPPISPKITQLPTPQMTPTAGTFCTPAAGCKTTGRARSMSRAMQHAHSLSMARCAIDSWPTAGVSVSQTCPKIYAPCARRTVIAPSSSLMSSPESMVSDVSSQSSRSSRSSSISSVASCVGALSQPRRLAVQATRRYATMHAMGTRDVPLVMRSISPVSDVWGCANPFSGAPAAAAEVSYLRGQSEDSEAAAAVALQDLALAGSDHSCGDRSISPAHNQRKRERPSSVVDSHLQEQVQGLLRREGSPFPQDDNSYAAKDADVASTFLLRPGCRLALREGAGSLAQAAAGSQTGSRKRVCCPGGM